MADIVGVVLSVVGAAEMITKLIDNYAKAQEFVQEVQSQCLHTRKVLAGLRLTVKKSHGHFHELADEFDRRLEVFLGQLTRFNFKETSAGPTSTQAAQSKILALRMRQEMIDMRQYILEKSMQVQSTLLYIKLQDQSDRYAQMSVPDKEPKRQEALFEAIVRGDDTWARNLLANKTPTGSYKLKGLITTPLHVAARYGRNAFIELLLKCEGVKVNARDSEGRTPLMIAVYHKQRETTKLLIKKGAEVNVADDVGTTPLHFAVKHDGIQAVNTLTNLRRKLDPNAVDMSGDTPLDAALKRESWPSIEEPHNTAVAVVDALLAKGAQPARVNGSDYTPLQRAAAQGRVPELNSLATAAAEMGLLDARTEILADPVLELHGASALWLAARGGHTEAVVLLLRLKADPSLRWDHPEYPTPLWAAYAAGHQGIAETLLQEGADPDGVNGKGQTILHMAWARESDKWTELLLARRTKRADPSKQDQSGYQPIHYAVDKNRHRVVELLKEGGAHLDAKDNTGRTPLMMCASKGNATLLLRLIKWGARLDIVDSDGRNAFFRAILAGDLMSAGYLLARGDDDQLNGPADGTGPKPLHGAIRKRNLEAVRWLLEHGAVLDDTSKDMARRVAEQTKEAEPEKDEILTFLKEFRKKDRGEPPRWKVELEETPSAEGKAVAKESSGEKLLSISARAKRPSIQNVTSRESAGKLPELPH